MITFFTIPKPFDGQIEAISRVDAESSVACKLRHQVLRHPL